METTHTHLITVTGQQAVGREIQKQQFTAPCTLTVRAGAHYIVYEEADEAGARTRITLKLEAARAVMLRGGASGTQMEFVPGRDTRCDYATAAGLLPLVVQTHTVRCHLTETGGTATLRYALYNGGALLSENEVNIRLRPVKSEHSGG